MFSTVYRVTQKDLYARPYTSMWAPVVAEQISKRYSYSSRTVPRLTSTEMLPHFWMRLFLDVGSEEEVLLPGPLNLRI